MQVTETAVGTNTSIQTAIPNGGSGIRISGNAHGNAIGGFQPSVEPQVTISANRGYGIEVVGSARDNVVFHTYIGTNFNGTAALGNRLGGISLGAGTSSTTIGGTAAALQNKILNSVGNGLSIRSSRGNAVSGNEIAGNQGYGLFADGLCSGSVRARQHDRVECQGECQPDEIPRHRVHPLKSSDPTARLGVSRSSHSPGCLARVISATGVRGPGRGRRGGRPATPPGPLWCQACPCRPMAGAR